MEQLSHGQKPEVLYIGCSDSYIMPSRILGAVPGDVFVVRNVANVVPPADAGQHAVGAVVEYAVIHLQVSHIVVCGHASCGGVQALVFPHDDHEPALSHWLDYARPCRERVPAGLKGRARLDATIESNVVLQVEHLKTYPCVREALDMGKLQIHAWVYDFLTGRVRAYDEMAGVFIEEPPFEE
jgi:carbonic anhydrase